AGPDLGAQFRPAEPRRQLIGRAWARQGARGDQRGDHALRAAAPAQQRASHLDAGELQRRHAQHHCARDRRAALVPAAAAADVHEDRARSRARQRPGDRAERIRSRRCPAETALMDPRLLRLYDQELRFIRDLGGEFAAEFPKIAGRLGLDAFECADPYVERLLEGFALLAARVHLKLESEFPTFTQNLLDIVYPHFLAPTPSMQVVNFRPDLQGGKFENGYRVPRDTSLIGVLGKGEVTYCEFRTAQDVTLWPVVVKEVEYLAGAAAISALALADQRGAKAAIRLRLETVGQVPFAALSLQNLNFFVRGATVELSTNILEQVLANAVGMAVRPPIRPVPWIDRLAKSQIGHIGLRDEEALLPFGPRSFQGYRLLSEYFAFPERFFFFSLNGLGPSIRRTEGTALEIFILLDRENKTLARGGLSPENLLLNCAPAINLFPGASTASTSRKRRASTMT